MTNKNQLLANEIHSMRGLTEKAKDMIAATDISIFCELFAGCTAEDLNRMAEEIEEDEA